MTAHRGDERRRDGEHRRVHDEGHRGRRHAQQHGTDRRADDHTEILHRVQQRVGGAQPGLPDESGQERDGRRLLCCAGRRRQRREGDHQHDRAVGGDHRRDGDHHEDPRQIADQQDGSAVMAVAHGATDHAEQDVGQEPSDNGCADPCRRARGAEDVAQHDGVAEPIANLGRAARHDQRSCITNREDVALRRPPTHRLLARHADSASPPAVVNAAPPARRTLETTISDRAMRRTISLSGQAACPALTRRRQYNRLRSSASCGTLNSVGVRETA